MSAPLSDAETKQYTNLIDGILMNADLETVTRKKIRQGLELALGGKDLSEQKNAIKALIEERFDAINTQNPSPGAMPTPPSAPLGEERGRPSPKREHSELNGHTDDGDDADGEIEVSLDEQPAKKKQKRDSKLEDADARLAAQLQAQENRMARTRTTRGGAVAKPTKPKKKTPKKKSASKIKGDDDSDVDSSEVSGTKRKASGGFQKPFNLSYPLAELCGESRLSRPQVVKKLWEYIKANELQDPNDKRQIRCDEKMHAVFKQNKVDMFQMNKLLGNQLYPIEEEEEKQ